jgi:hypothetical protein
MPLLPHHTEGLRKARGGFQVRGSTDQLIDFLGGIILGTDFNLLAIRYCCVINERTKAGLGGSHSAECVMLSIEFARRQWLHYQEGDGVTLPDCSPRQLKTSRELVLTSF